ncbi:hypothetical protein PIB30_051362 [Stylosanthes scabra]|uniref:Uncharacterized protein n=1 Tax=Stylosanthes scabra TaxID=79078 RepID=A0ABU6QHA0_9FABA|nr:hypothetical protein [Stylosanthes scabra]
MLTRRCGWGRRLQRGGGNKGRASNVAGDSATNVAGACAKGDRTMYLYVEPEMGENLAHTPFVGRTINTQSSQASAQRGSENSTPNPTAEENPTAEGAATLEARPLLSPPRWRRLPHPRLLVSI